MAQLPLVQDQSQMQTRWKAILDPVIALPLNTAIPLKSVQLKLGVTQIPHLLSRKQQGWVITDIQGGASIYRSQPFNDKFLVLTSNADVIVDLLVY